MSEPTSVKERAGAHWDCNMSGVIVDAMKHPHAVLASMIQGAVPEVITVALGRRKPGQDLMLSVSITPRLHSEDEEEI